MSRKDRDHDFLLEFPDAPDFISDHPNYSLAEMIKLSEKMLPHWNAKRYEPGSPYLEEIHFEEFVIPSKKNTPEEAG